MLVLIGSCVFLVGLIIVFFVRCERKTHEEAEAEILAAKRPGHWTADRGW